MGYWRTTPIVIDAMFTNTMSPAASGIGAAVSARMIRLSPCVREAKCSQIVYRPDIRNSPKSIVLTLIPAIRGIVLLNGTP